MQAKLTPARKLAMPDKSVASQLLAIRSRKIGNDISLGVRESVLRRLDGIPLFKVSLLAGKIKQESSSPFAHCQE